LLEAIITNDGEEAIVKTDDGQSSVLDGKAEVATMTGDEIVYGTQTVPEIETVEILEITDLGSVVTAPDGTELGTLEDSITITDDYDGIVT